MSWTNLLDDIQYIEYVFQSRQTGESDNAINARPIPTTWRIGVSADTQSHGTNPENPLRPSGIAKPEYDGVETSAEVRDKTRDTIFDMVCGRFKRLCPNGLRLYDTDCTREGCYDERR